MTNGHRHQQGGRGGPPPGRGGRDGPAPPLQQLPAARTVSYFADANRKALNADLVDQKARSLAEQFKHVPASQIRRFFSDVITFAHRGDATNAEAIKAHMALLKAKAAYGYRRVQDRQRETFPDALLQFFVDHAAAVKDARDFEAFRKAFEAVIAYHKFYEEKKQRD